MIYLLIFLHIFVSIILIAVVLMQSGKGAEMGASFGAGGSQSVFGAGGGSTFMSKMTTGAAIIFMLTSLVLAYQSGKSGSSSIMSSAPKVAPQKPAAPASQPAQTKPAAPAPTGQPLQAPAPAAPAQK
ncbi:preprotein translocase subunit SecG [Geobacter argillaceus]|uniref:Protein-export membrane protein SecG n=1 Tax=Geobacter argillaceus TaxID=345631 RepID=A0A562V794_9BACT|nr:preprotein translocase subunit SecG [Geobacter argillaceus]TWJ13775.1 protein translocase subunit secG [Geobacter argillaceus]